MGTSNSGASEVPAAVKLVWEMALWACGRQREEKEGVVAHAD